MACVVVVVVVTVVVVLSSPESHVVVVVVTVVVHVCGLQISDSRRRSHESTGRTSVESLLAFELDFLTEWNRWSADCKRLTCESLLLLDVPASPQISFSRRRNHASCGCIARARLDSVTQLLKDLFAACLCRVVWSRPTTIWFELLDLIDVRGTAVEELPDLRETNGSHALKAYDAHPSDGPCFILWVHCDSVCILASDLSSSSYSDAWHSCGVMTALPLS